MKYQLVYKEHADDFGNWLVRNERGEYAAAPWGVQGAKPRRWRTSELASSFMETRAAYCVDMVWLSEIIVCQGKPGATSMRHSSAAAYKPAHGGYQATAADLKIYDEIARASRRRADRRINEVPPVGTVHTGGNEEASTIPDAVLFTAIGNAGNPDSPLRGLLVARYMFPKL